MRIESGRYERPRKAAEDRICRQCNENVPETEIHFLLYCPKHCLIRAKFFSKITSEDFETLSDIEKVTFILGGPGIAKQSAQFIIDAFDNRIVE